MQWYKKEEIINFEIFDKSKYSNKRVWISVFTEYDQNGWVVNIGGKWKRFKTKLEALKFAKKYMKAHPSG